MFIFLQTFRSTRNFFARVYNLEIVPVNYENSVNEAVNTTDTFGKVKKNLWSFFYKLLGAFYWSQNSVLKQPTIKEDLENLINYMRIWKMDAALQPKLVEEKVKS